MKKITLTTILSIFMVSLFFAQDVKKYVLLEHFTNTYCSLCPGRNAVLHNLITNYPMDVHHITYNPSVPYPQCPLYQANTAENGARQGVYNVPGTPRLFMLGQSSGSNTPLLQENVLTAELNQTSPLELIVTETEGLTRDVQVAVKTHGTFNAAPGTDYRLFVALVEQELNFNAANGEMVHYNIFRKMLSNIDGDSFSAAAVGAETMYNYNYTIDESEWVADEMYVVAFIQEVNSRDIVNSGTRFDERIVSDVDDLNQASFSIFPNPTQDKLTIDLGDISLKDPILSIYDLTGKIVYSENLAASINTKELNIKSFATGVYFVKIQNDQQTFVQKLVKE